MMQHCILVLFLLIASTDAFLIGPGASRRLTATATTTSSLQMAGFGAAPKKGDQKKTKELKPKQQWDRYSALKTAEAFAVAVRVVDSTSAASESSSTPASDEMEGWMQVGYVRSKGNVYTGEAVTRQRLLIAEHARRLHPLKVGAKDTLEWAYVNKDEKVVTVGKSLFSKLDMPADIEKMIGFVGLPDTSGFYEKSALTITKA
jgi:hypothetical protein